MCHALELAQFAWNEGEIPVGAVLIHNDQIIGEGWNRSISFHDPTAHAEIVALRQGGSILKNYRLLDTTLYVTLEPCLMCFGAIICGRVDTLVYGANAKQIRKIESLVDISKYIKSNHQVNIINEILAPTCSMLLNDFFHTCRLKNKKKN